MNVELLEESPNFQAFIKKVQEYRSYLLHSAVYEDDTQKVAGLMYGVRALDFVLCITADEKAAQEIEEDDE